MKKLLILLSVSVFLLTACLEKEETQEQSAPVEKKPVVATVEAKEEAYSPVLEFGGSFKPFREANLSARMPGKIKKIHYREHGDTYLLVANALTQMPEMTVDFFHELHREKMKAIINKLKNGVESGKVKNDVDLEILVKMLNLVSQLFCLTKDLSPEADDYERVKKTFVNVFNYGLLNK